MMLDETTFEFNRISDFKEIMNWYITNWKVKPDLTDIDLVKDSNLYTFTYLIIYGYNFFILTKLKYQVLMPIIHKGKYYLQVFNLKGGRCFIIDHVKRKGALEEIYGSVPRKMVNYLFI